MKNKLSMYLYVGFEVFCSVISSRIGVIFLNVKTELFRYKKTISYKFFKELEHLYKNGEFFEERTDVGHFVKKKNRNKQFSFSFCFSSLHAFRTLLHFDHCTLQFYYF